MLHKRSRHGVRRRHPEVFGVDHLKKEKTEQGNLSQKRCPELHPDVPM